MKILLISTCSEENIELTEVQSIKKEKSNIIRVRFKDGREQNYENFIAVAGSSLQKEVN